MRLQWRAGMLGGVHILRDTRVQPHQLIRNVVSGLHAGVGIAILPTQVHVHDDAGALEAVAEAIDAANASTPTGNGTGAGASNGTHTNGAASTAPVPVAHESPRNGNGHGNGHNGHGPAAQPAARVRTPRPAEGVGPARASSGDALNGAAELLRERREHAHAHDGLQLERIDIERRGGTLRCRTVLALNGRTYSAIAEVPDAPAAEAELAARVAVDALRAGGLTDATLDGVGFITISDVNYCVTTVREPGRPAPRAGAAPMIDSMAASATAAVLTALGTYMDARPNVRARTAKSTNANL